MTYFGGGSVSGQPMSSVSLAAGPPPGPQLGPGQMISAEALRHQTAATLQRCYRWLERAVPSVPQLAALIPTMVAAVQLYEAQQYQASLAQSAAVIQAAYQVQATMPHLAPL